MIEILEKTNHSIRFVVFIDKVVYVTVLQIMRRLLVRKFFAI